jgi:hypothetical protein
LHFFEKKGLTVFQMHHWNHGTLDENHFHVWTVSWGRPYTENTGCILSIQKIAIIRLGKNSGSNHISGRFHLPVPQM